MKNTAMALLRGRANCARSAPPETGEEPSAAMQRLIAPARTILRHRGFMVLLGCNVLVGLAFSFVGPFLSLFATQEVGMSQFAYGAFMVGLSLSAIASSTVLARWSDTRLSRRTVLLLGGFTGAAGYVGFAFVRDVTWLIVIGCVPLAVASITFSQLFAHARDLLERSAVPPNETPLYMNVFRLAFALAWTVGPAAASWVMMLDRFRGTFLVAALCFLLFALAVVFLVPATPPSATARAAAAKLPLRRVLARPDVLAYFVGFALLFASSTMAMANLPLLVTQTLGGTARDVGIVYSVAPFFELPFMFYLGLLATKSDQARLIRFAVVMSVAYYTLLALVRAPWHIYPLQILSAAITAVIGGIAITFFQNFLPDQAGTATNLYTNAARFGSTAGYLMFGAVAEAWGNRAVFWICTLLCAVALALLTAFGQQTGRHGFARPQTAPTIS